MGTFQAEGMRVQRPCGRAKHRCVGGGQGRCGFEGGEGRKQETGPAESPGRPCWPWSARSLEVQGKGKPGESQRGEELVSISKG